MKERAPQLTAVQQALERERHFLAEELHEGLCQQLCGIALHLKVLERRLSTEAARFSGEFGELQRSFETAIDNARFLYRTLKPPIWDLQSFVAALKELTESKGGSFQYSSTVKTEDSFFSKEVAMGFFRIAQEALRDFRNLTAAPSWRLTLDLDEASVRMVIGIDPKSYKDVVKLDLWKGLGEVAKGVGSLTLEETGNPVTLVCKANRN